VKKVLFSQFILYICYITIKIYLLQSFIKQRKRARFWVWHIKVQGARTFQNSQGYFTSWNCQQKEAWEKFHKETLIMRCWEQVWIPKKNFKTRNFVKVCVASDETLDIEDMKDINLKTSTSIVWTLKDVRYVPGFKRMLIFVSILDVQGYQIIFGDDQW